jgi:hypothetical protein
MLNFVSYKFLYKVCKGPMDWINESIYGAVDNTERLRPTRTSLVLNLSTLLSDGFGNPPVSKNIKFFFLVIIEK